MEVARRDKASALPCVGLCLGTGLDYGAAGRGCGGMWPGSRGGGGGGSGNSEDSGTEGYPGLPLQATSREALRRRGHPAQSARGSECQGITLQQTTRHWPRATLGDAT